MITLEEMQNFFRTVRSNPQIDLIRELTESEEGGGGRRGDRTKTIAGPDAPAGAIAGLDAASEAATTPQQQQPVAAATAPAIPTIPGARLPKHKIQMFYNVKGGTGKSTLTAQYVMRAAMMGLNVLAIDLDGQGHLTVNLDVLDAHERADHLRRPDQRSSDRRRDHERRAGTRSDPRQPRSLQYRDPAESIRPGASTGCPKRSQRSPTTTT